MDAHVRATKYLWDLTKARRIKRSIENLIDYLTTKSTYFPRVRKLKKSVKRLDDAIKELESKIEELEKGKT